MEARSGGSSGVDWDAPTADSTSSSRTPEQQEGKSCQAGIPRRRARPPAAVPRHAPRHLCNREPALLSASLAADLEHLNQICTHLTTRDLLSLSLSAKVFRKPLAAPESGPGIWAAHRRAAELPIFKNMSEIAFAHLIDGENCTVGVFALEWHPRLADWYLSDHVAGVRHDGPRQDGPRLSNAPLLQVPQVHVGLLSLPSLLSERSHQSSDAPIGTAGSSPRRSSSSPCLSFTRRPPSVSSRLAVSPWRVHPSQLLTPRPRSPD
mgnify:CR=1 FL=1